MSDAAQLHERIEVRTLTGSDGIDIRTDVIGTEGSQSIVFVHGFSGSRLVWEQQLSSSLADDFQLVAVDLRGHGRSEKPEDAYGDSEHWASDIRAVIDELALDNPVLVGWSVGNGWICDYLLVNGDDDIAGVNMVGPRIALRDEDPTKVFGEGMLELIRSGVFASTDIEQATAGLEEFVSLWTAEPVPPKEHVFLLGTVAMVPPRVRAGQLGRTGTIVYDDVLSRLETPALITHGEMDEIILPQVADTIADIIPNAKTSLYPEVGHMPFLESPDRFNRELREFVSFVTDGR